jgi:hypothetical protein
MAAEDAASKIDAPVALWFIRLVVWPAQVNDGAGVSNGHLYLQGARLLGGQDHLLHITASD